MAAPQRQEQAMALTKRQMRFVAEYPVDLNAAAAAVRAGYSPETARKIGYRLRHKPEIAEAIRAHDESFIQRAGISFERVLNQAACIVFADPRRFCHPDGSMKALHELDADSAAAVAVFVVDERPDGRRIVRVRLHDKMPALLLLGRHLEMARPQGPAAFGHDWSDAGEPGAGDGPGDSRADEVAAALKRRGRVLQ
jgi:phage terminase small subunit